MSFIRKSAILILSDLVAQWLIPCANGLGVIKPICGELTVVITTGGHWSTVVFQQQDMMMSPHLFWHTLIRFQAWYAEEAWEAPNNELTLFTMTEPVDDEVMINMQLENGPELTTNQQGRSTNVTPQQLQNIMEWLLRGYCLYEDEAGENALSLFYNQGDQENGYSLYMSYLDAKQWGWLTALVPTELRNI